MKIQKIYESKVATHRCRLLATHADFWTQCRLLDTDGDCWIQMQIAQDKDACSYIQVHVASTI